MAIHITVEPNPSPEAVERLSEGLTEHALPTTGVRGFLPIAVFARDEESRIVGGAAGLLNWSWLHVSLLWVHEDLRGQGLGSKLLRSLEAVGRDRGCLHAHLDTFSYQAKPFYEREGYFEFARLRDYPPGHDRIFLRKDLAPGEAT